MSLLEVKDLHGGYGGAPILNGVNMSIDKEDVGRDCGAKWCG